jgi:dihydroorotate dehydrogenase
MYKSIIRPILFAINPETVHHLVVMCLKIGFAIPGFRYLVTKAFAYNHPSLQTNVFGLSFPNKVGLAAGFDKKANIYNHMAAFGFGHVEIGTVNPLPQPGNPKPRLFRLKKDQALINRMGFNNPGVDVFVKNLKKVAPKVIIGGNIGKNTLTPNENAADDYLTCFHKLHPWVDYFVVNVSCPNIKGLNKLTDKDELVKLLSKIQEANQSKAQTKPVLLKIAPDLNHPQLDEVLEIVALTGIDGIIATNTTTSREGLITDAARVEQLGNGGLSGKPLTSKSTQVIQYLNDKSQGKLPIIAAGGIMSADDALEKIKAGASLVQIYTGFVYEGPALIKKINEEIARNL